MEMCAASPEFYIMRLLWLPPGALPDSIPQRDVCFQWTDASFKVIGVDISSDGFSRLLEITILREICFLVLETAKPAFNHDIICPAAFTIHTLTNSIIPNKFDVFVTGKLAALILVDD